MNRQGKVWITAGLMAIVAAGCFDDPTSSLRNGPAALNLSRAAVTVTAGDSIAVTATVVDDQGNPLPTAAVSWTSADPTVAAVAEDVAQPAPGAVFTRAFVRGVTNQAGITSVTLSANGLSAQLRVTVLPATFPGSRTVTGTAGADTVTINRPSPLPPLVITYSAGDTLVLDATGTITFDAATTTVTLGAVPADIFAISSTQIKAIARTAFAGRATITNLTYAGNAETGPVLIANLRTDSFNIQRARWRPVPPAVMTADPNFGANTIITVTAPAGVTFGATSGLGIGGTPAVGSTAAIPPTAIIILNRTATTLSGISPATVTGTLLVTNLLLNGGAVDSLRTGSVATGSVSITKAAFPGTVTQSSTNLLGVITINAGTAAFTTAAATASQVTVGGVTAHILTRSATTITAIAKLTNTGPISISNVIVGGSTIPSLATTGNVTVTSTTGEANEPANNASGGATVLGTLNAANDSIVVFGAMDGGADQADYYRFVTNVTGTISVRLDFFGNGSGASDVNPDFDVVVCTTLSGAGNCSYGQDIIPSNAGSGLVNPEAGTTASVTAGSTVYVRLFAYYATAAGLGSYRLRVKTP